MTCTIGIVKNGVAYIGADSGVFIENEQYFTTSRKKVRKLKFKYHEVILGFCGDWSAWDVIDMWETETINPENILMHKLTDKQFIYQVFIPELKRLFKQNPSAGEWEFLMGLNGSIYYITQDYGVMPIPKQGYAIGSGAEPARGVLYYIDEQKIDMAVDKQIRSALKAAAKTVNTVKGPYHVINN